MTYFKTKQRYILHIRRHQEWWILECNKKLRMIGFVNWNNTRTNSFLEMGKSSSNVRNVFKCLSLTGPCWKINSFLSEISVCRSCAEKRIKIERAFSIILRASPATHRSLQQSPQLPTVTVANLRFNKQLATADARWLFPSTALVGCIVDSSTVCWHKCLLIEVATVALADRPGANVY